MSSLPPPSSLALAHSQLLVDLIHSEIIANNDWMSFARFMELALYAPGLGYYSAGLEKLGEGGDFVTAPEISPLFGRTLARQLVEILRETGGDVLELGAGSGKLAADVLQELARLDCLPEHYFILDVSASLRQRQQQTVQSLPAHLAEKVIWLDALPASFNGVILGNEVLDALPIHLVFQGEGQLFERGVTLTNGVLIWQDKPLTSGALFEAALALNLPLNYLTEINLAASGLVASLADCLQHGLIMWLDYGFPKTEYTHPQRDGGTLMCHYRHYAHADPLIHLGLQDITAHVDFSAVAEIGIKNDLKLLGYTSQAQFLINCGITDLLAETSPEDVAAYMPQVAAVQKLLSPAEMGELFKVIALGKHLKTPLMGFKQGDQGFRL
ncbi:MAG: SAM-dependent methyltransferase [Methylophilales bacterium]|nr:SAM-dependent methyltransferase [Methylophilales bacterium]